MQHIPCYADRLAPSDDDEHVSVCGGLEERRLAGHLAPELAAGGEVHVREHEPCLHGLVLLAVDVPVEVQ